MRCISLRAWRRSVVQTQKHHDLWSVLTGENTACFKTGLLGVTDFVLPTHT